MTDTLIARCARSGRLGIATASYTLAIGAYCDGAVRPNVGATLTQGAPLVRNNRLAINSLAMGATPQLALRALEHNDEHFDYRQIAILDRDGAGASRQGLQGQVLLLRPPGWSRGRRRGRAPGRSLEQRTDRSAHAVYDVRGGAQAPVGAGSRTGWFTCGSGPRSRLGTKGDGR